MIRRRLALALLRVVDCMTSKAIIALLWTRDLAGRLACAIEPDLHG